MSQIISPESTEKFWALTSWIGLANQLPSATPDTSEPRLQQSTQSDWLSDEISRQAVTRSLAERPRVRLLRVHLPAESFPLVAPIAVQLRLGSESFFWWGKPGPGYFERPARLSARREFIRFVLRVRTALRAIADE